MTVDGGSGSGGGGGAGGELVTWLRAAGEPSRLRLLALCGQRDLSVSDLAQALRQSEPRVSRHLRILCEAGLLERIRQGQWVHYRLARAARAAGFVQGLLAQLDRRDPVLAGDLARAHGNALDASGEPRSAESRLGRALRGFIGTAPVPGSVLLLGVGHLELLAAAAALGRSCTAVGFSRRSAQGARAFAERAGLNCRVTLGSAGVIGERELARAGAPFDAMILDRLAGEAALGEVLAGCRRALAADGRLWLFERYDALEAGRGRSADPAGVRVIEHPLARLRRILGDHGLRCDRLSPIEADGEHVLAAVATPLAEGRIPAADEHTITARRA